MSWIRRLWNTVRPGRVERDIARELSFHLAERQDQLRAEGLFDPARKKPLPFLPHTIGLITGENSDAEKDVHRNAELRWPQVRFRTKYAAVQGERCERIFSPT